MVDAFTHSIKINDPNRGKSNLIDFWVGKLNFWMYNARFFEDRLKFRSEYENVGIVREAADKLRNRQETFANRVEENVMVPAWVLLLIVSGILASKLVDDKVQKVIFGTLVGIDVGVLTMGIWGLGRDLSYLVTAPIQNAKLSADIEAFKRSDRFGL